MANDPTFGDLYKAKAIVEGDLTSAIDAFMADPTTSRFAISEGYTADLAAAIAASPFARNMLESPDTKVQSKRSAVRTAILLSRPVKT